MADVEFELSQLVNLAIGSPETGAVNFNLLQKVLIELLRITELDTATVRLSASDAAKLEETYSVKRISREEPGADEPIRRSGLHHCPIDPQKVDQLIEDVNQLKFDVEDLTQKVTMMSDKTETVPFQEMRSSLTQVDVLQEKVANLEKILESFSPQDLDLDGGEERTIGQRLNYVEKHIEFHADELEKINTILDDKLKNIMGQVEDMEKDMGKIHDQVTITASASKMSMPASNASQDLTSTVNNVITRLGTVQHDLDNLNLITNNLTEEQKEKEIFFEALSEQVELLRLVKADKTNMEDILAAKADMSQVHRKVSHDHFVTKMDELNVLVEDAFSRLNTHEEMWQEEVEQLKEEIERKLDIMEFSPLKDYVNEKLTVLQDKMKAIAAQKKEGMAAGSKRKIIRDVQCISCDNESVMKMENTIEDIKPPPPLPGQHSIKPYLTYKLDQVRKQQKKLPSGRNLLHFEEILQNASDPRKNRLFQSASRSGEHLVNRYVGGSHTITTPQQRVTRAGNFYETWGPIITAVNQPQNSPA